MTHVNLYWYSTHRHESSFEHMKKTNSSDAKIFK